MNPAGNGSDIEQGLRALAQQAEDDLKALVSIESVYRNDNEKKIGEAANKCAELLRGAGMDVEVIHPQQNSPNGRQGPAPAPIVYASRPCGDVTAPTVLLYAHYDVVPGSWKDAFKPQVDQGRMKGRGAADDKSGVMMHVTTCRFFQRYGHLPVNVKIVLEGEEEAGTDTLERYMHDYPDRFKADVVSLADGGNVGLGKPTLATSLRGFVMADVSVSTLNGDVHSGMYGGPVPDAYMALTKILATLHDDEGNVAVPGLKQKEWQGYQPDRVALRKGAKIKDGVPLIGTGSLGSQLYTKPSVTVVGLDRLPAGEPLPGTKGFRNALLAGVRARLTMRIAPGDTPENAFTCLKNHLLRRDVNPWRAEASVSYVSGAPGFEVRAEGGPGYQAAEKALLTVYQAEQVHHAGQGGSIPLTNTLGAINPHADILIWGCEEPATNIHADHESVSLNELHSMTCAQVLLILALAGKQEPLSAHFGATASAGSAF
ncbi:M20/M25/M40 family metallo-hydrolase [Streptomyces sp. AV19]|uniref:M20/M25/M40 family metallo-hydrolase n=1 Tax=Streptomyces sp. AV19 TaxID=2793068 RepID=UPI0018FF0120|nr:M20/M25/M40 family metallo-hydrolase [Streptomyces sp. AV19]MBH1934247.1 M20/M25/M40 family metallo-hydrolase [Streptomyces sp. AV19]MDG4533444.1 M20/M25/M40 family metallo-hydrolase [Streptomyces sp. AV19]